MEGVYPEGSEDFFFKDILPEKLRTGVSLKHNSTMMTIKTFTIKERVMDYKKERTQWIILGIRVLQFLLLSSKLCLI